MNADLRRELERLLSGLCDGALCDVEHARLEQLLADTECRRYYLEYVDIHARLLVHPGLGAALPVTPSDDETALVGVARRRAKAGHLLRYVAVAASTLAASLLVQFGLWHARDVADNPAPRVAVAPAKLPAPPAKPVATLMQTADCAWRKAHEPLRAGVRLEPGKLALEKGLARIRFDNGSELLVEGPAELRLDASDAATLLCGKVVFHSDVMAGPFDLHTPAATLVDLGTEYGVTVGPDGEELHVFEGDVQRVPRHGEQADPEYLQRGEACRCNAGAFVSRPTKFDPAQFVRRLAAPPVPDAAAGLLAFEGFDYKVSDALSSGKANGGHGWTSPWTVAVARPLEWGPQKLLPLNVGESLTRPAATVPAVGGRFDHAGFGVYYRQLKTPLRLDTDAVYYVSCLIRRAGPAGQSFNVAALMLRPNESGDGQKGKWKEREHHRHEHRNARPNLGNRLMVGTGGANQVFARVGAIAPARRCRCRVTSRICWWPRWRRANRASTRCSFASTDRASRSAPRSRKAGR